MQTYEERLTTLEAEVVGLRRFFEDLFVSNLYTLPKKRLKGEKLLDLFGTWEGDIDDFLQGFYIRRERRGRLE